MRISASTFRFLLCPLLFVIFGAYHRAPGCAANLFLPEFCAQGYLVRYSQGYYGAVIEWVRTSSDAEPHLVIPDTINGYPVIGIESGALSGLGFGTVQLPAYLQSIADGAFVNCPNLTSVHFPESLQSIGDSAFENCANLTSVSLPAGLTELGAYAFANCNRLTSAILPPGLTGIPSGLFSGCTSLTDFTCPAGVTQIGDYSFLFCSNLRTIVWPTALTSIGNFAYWNCTSLATLDLPEGLISIGEGAFYFCENLTSANLPESLTSLGARAFEECENLTSVNLPAQLISLGNSTFANCHRLSQIELPAALTTIGSGAFANCSLLLAPSFPNGLTSIGAYAFSDCKRFTSLTFPASLTAIGDQAFADNYDLEKAIFLGDAPQMGQDVFRNASSFFAEFRIYYARSALGFTTPTWLGYPTTPGLPQTITFDKPANRSLANPVLDLSQMATASSGLPLTFVLLSGPASLSGTTLTLLGTGLVFVRAEQPGDAMWSSAEPVTQSIDVVPLTVDLMAALDVTDVDVSTSGDAGWQVDTEITFDGIDALRSGSLSSLEESTLTLQVTDATEVRFYWKLASTNNANLKFWIDGLPKVSITGVVDWTQLSFPLTPGPHTLKWILSASFVGNVPSAWVDQVELVPSPTGFEIWAEAAGLAGDDALASADPDGDGIDNLLEYALGTPPNSGNFRPAHELKVQRLAEAFHFSLSHRRRKDSGANFSYLASEDLTAPVENWLPVTGTTSVINSNVDGDDRVEMVEVTFPALSADAIYLMIKVSL